MSLLKEIALDMQTGSQRKCVSVAFKSYVQKARTELTKI